MIGALARSVILHARVAARRRRWLVAGSAGFIGSHLLETLLMLGQEVVSVDNFSTGYAENLEAVRRSVGDAAWRSHRFIDGDIADPEVCGRACNGVDIALHQAALGSVPRSIESPLATHAANATGFLNILVALHNAGVGRLVYAASSATFGNHPGLPEVEHEIGRPFSPYAVTKYLNELYADVFARCYGTQSIGLRYFNVFGPRQDPEGAYAAVIPRWTRALLRGEPVMINGDGETSRDFCYVANAVDANLRAALVNEPEAVNQVYNIAAGSRTTLQALNRLLRELVVERVGDAGMASPVLADFRPGDVRHAQADIAKARAFLGYEPTHDLFAGLRATLPWFIARFRSRGAAVTQCVDGALYDA